MIHSLPRITLQVQNKQMHETCWLEKQPRAAETFKKKKSDTFVTVFIPISYPLLRTNSGRLPC